MSDRCGEDLFLCGWKIDIKTTVYRQGKLVHRLGTRYPSDVYVPVVLDEQHLQRSRPVGCAWREELLRGEAVDWHNAGLPARVLRQSWLRPNGHLPFVVVPRTGAARRGGR